ncbi:MAG: ABC-F family ATP-binding cassette domain-containing protein [Actinobacteria bacterium]|nr:ABC-F family ATP-binding cassette domain-containing protein [Actinomycetota bacterium]
MNLLNLEKVSKDYGKGAVLNAIQLGISAGERIGVVGRNGGGKSTLLRVMAEIEPPDSGRVTHENSLRLGFLHQIDRVPAHLSLGEFLFPEMRDHEWASDGRIRDILIGLFGDLNEMDRPLDALSGGERRRVSLAQLLVADNDIIFLDEPTNHLDVEGVAWLANHLRSRTSMALVVVTHDRWFLDEVCDQTWEVINGDIEVYDGGYSSYVLAKAERTRQASVEEARRQNLIRKELAWLRRGAPARTTKPKFRIDAANQLIANEPMPRKSDELLSFAGARLGKRVFELHDIELRFGERVLIDRLTLNIGPGDRMGIMGPNGAGKTTLLKMLNGTIKVSAGHVQVGSTVKIGYLSQQLDELNPEWRVLEAVEDVARHVDLGKGRELSASQLCERLGFGSDAQWTPVRDLSGGERRRLQLTRILMAGPNVLFLDEPTNDFDVETLSSLEDLLDGFVGTLLVVSHDRYFLERVCDTMFGIFGDGTSHDLPRGIDQYLEIRKEIEAKSPNTSSLSMGPLGSAAPKSAAEERLAKKEREKVERQLAKLDKDLKQVHLDMAAASTDYPRLAALTEELRIKEKSVNELEELWLTLAD